MNINKFVKLPKDNKKIQIVKFFEKLGLDNICKDAQNKKNKKYSICLVQSYIKN